MNLRKHALASGGESGARQLQWGRRGEPAETGASLRARGRAVGFNGAAGVNLRKPFSRMIARANLLSFNGAAGVNLRKLVDLPAVTRRQAASMGPQG